MTNTNLKKNGTERKTYIITGPTSGIGRATAFELAKYGDLVLVGRNRNKLEELKGILAQNGQQAITVVCDLSDMASVRRAAAEIIAMNLSISGLLNNAGIMSSVALKSAQGWDLTYATNHLGPFAFTEALVPHLPDGTQVVFIVSAIEDPERKPVKVLGMKGGRYISAVASARGEWKAGGTSLPGMDAYATSKQCSLAATMALARQTPNLRFNAIEPGITSGTGLGGDGNAFGRFVFGQIITRFPPFRQYKSTPDKAAHVITNIVTNESKDTGVYYDEKGKPMLGSSQVRDPKFQNLVLAETRDFLAKAQI